MYCDTHTSWCRHFGLVCACMRLWPEYVTYMYVTCVCVCVCASVSLCMPLRERNIKGDSFLTFLSLSVHASNATCDEHRYACFVSTQHGGRHCSPTTQTLHKYTYTYNNYMCTQCHPCIHKAHNRIVESTITYNSIIIASILQRSAMIYLTEHHW